MTEPARFPLPPFSAEEIQQRSARLRLAEIARRWLQRYDRQPISLPEWYRLDPSGVVDLSMGDWLPPDQPDYARDYPLRFDEPPWADYFRSVLTWTNQQERTIR